MASEIKRFYLFEGFEFDSQRLSLEYQERSVNLPPKSLQTLKVLLEHRGETVSRETLIAEIWHDAFVEDSNLTVAVSTLRKTLSSFVENGDLIQTVPREGYRFVGDVSEKVHISEQPVIVERRRYEQYTLEDVEISEPSIVRKFIGSTLTERRGFVYGFAAVALLAVAAVFAALLLADTKAVEPMPQKLAVLPFKSFEGLPDDNGVGLGFADSLITRLGAFENTKILPIGSVSSFLGTASDPAAYGRDLGADAVIEGSFIRADGRLRVNVRLIRTSDGKQIWNGTFDDEKDALFRLHDRIAIAVSHSLGPRPLPANYSGKLTQNPEAYHNYLMGDHLLKQRGWNVVKAVPFFEKAIELDANFTRAYIGLATAHAMNAARLDKAEAALATASKLDPDHPEIHSLKGFIEMFHNWNWHRAEQHFERALELEPNSVTALHWRGEYRKLRGQFDSGERDLLRALELDPLSPIIRSDLAELYYFAGNDEESIRQNERVLAIDPTNQFANSTISLSLRRLGRVEESFERYLEFSVANRNFVSKEEEMRYRSFMTELYRKGGENAVKARSEQINLRKAVNGEDIYSRLNARIRLSEIEMDRGNHDKALDMLFSVVSELNSSGKPKNFMLYKAAVDPRFEPVRNSPRFLEILTRINLSS